MWGPRGTFFWSLASPRLDKGIANQSSCGTTARSLAGLWKEKKPASSAPFAFLFLFSWLPWIQDLFLSKGGFDFLRSRIAAQLFVRFFIFSSKEKTKLKQSSFTFLATKIIMCAVCIWCESSSPATVSQVLHMQVIKELDCKGTWLIFRGHYKRDLPVAAHFGLQTHENWCWH